MKYIVYKTLRFILKPVFKLIFNPTVIGIEKIPSSGCVILAGNHTHPLDALLMLYGPKRIVHMMAKKELFNNVLTRWFFTSMACISVDRSVHDKKAKSDAIHILNNGEIVGIFPEGTINKTDKIIMDFKYGAVSIASKTNSKIIPFSITGSYFKRNITIVYGKPFSLNEDLEKENKKLMKLVSNLIKENMK